jgi:predicted nucleic acid-binding protein
MAIASCLVDTNILLRMTRRSDPQHQVVDAALARLAGQGTILDRMGFVRGAASIRRWMRCRTRS